MIIFRTIIFRKTCIFKGPFAKREEIVSIQSKITNNNNDNALACLGWSVPATHLVVDDNVDGAMRGVRGQVAQVERLIDDALARERRVAVQQYAHHLRGQRVHAGQQVRKRKNDKNFTATAKQVDDQH